MVYINRQLCTKCAQQTKEQLFIYVRWGWNGEDPEESTSQLQNQEPVRSTLEEKERQEDRKIA